MIKTVREKLLENRIVRLEKLISDRSKRRVNENIPHSGMTLGEIMKMLMGTTDDYKTLDDIESMTDIHFQVAEVAGLEDEYAALDFMADHWDDKCHVVINKGLGSGGSDDVNISFAGITIGLDWLDEDEEEAYEARKRASRRSCRR